MISLPQSVRVFLAEEPCDMRKGIDGLVASTKVLGQDPFSGHLFVFVARRRNRVKILTWDKGGFVVYYKRLERGLFKLPPIQPGQRTVRLAPTDLALLLEGVDLRALRRPPLWEPPNRLS